MPTHCQELGRHLDGRNGTLTNPTGTELPIRVFSSRGRTPTFPRTKSPGEGLDGVSWDGEPRFRLEGVELPISFAARMALLRACHASVHFSADLNQNAVRNSCWTWTRPPLPSGMLALSFSAAECMRFAKVATPAPSSDSSLTRTLSSTMKWREQAQTRKIRLVSSGVTLFRGVAHQPSY